MVGGVMVVCPNVRDGGRGVVVWAAATMSLKASYPPRMQRSCADGMIVLS